MSTVVQPTETPGRVRLRGAAARVGRWITSTSYLQKWIILGVGLGIVAGLGAVLFYETLSAATHLFLGVLVGYQVPTPAGEGARAGSHAAARPWALPLIAGAGALAGAILVYRFAPEAEGHGTDAAISAVHHNPRGVRLRAVIVKIIASALTIGSGGSGGREGPTGQISAGFGSLATRILDLEPADGRVLVATGIGSGIGAIFGAPLGGAVLAAEILYRDDFDPSALLPCFIASGVSFLVFGGIEGYSPLFGYFGGYHFSDPVQLLWFGLIGVLGGLIGLLYAKGFYGMADLFARSPLPKWANPAIGGLIVGSIGIAIPEVLGTGYGFIQKSLGPGLMAIPLWVVLILPLARIVATGLSIGSGGSGGIFGPGMVIGAFIGAAVWRLFEPIAPSMGHNPAPYVIIGMMCCFGSISRAPVAVMLMVAEMTGSLSILAPAMIAVGLAWFIVRRGDDTIYRSQLKSRADAPAQRLLAGLPLLAAVPTARAMAEPRLVVMSSTPRREAVSAMTEAGVSVAPVVDREGRFEGTISLEGLKNDSDGGDLRGLVDAGAPAVALSSQLDVALESLATAPLSWTPILDADRHVVGTLSMSDVVRAYRHELASRVEQASTVRDDTGASCEVVIEANSSLAGRALRDAGLRNGMLVTSIERGDEVIVPSGDTVLAVGDRLAVLGSLEVDDVSPEPAEFGAEVSKAAMLRRRSGTESP